MNTKQFERMRKDPGFIAALDQSGGSTPKALKAYGIEETAFRTKPAFTICKPISNC